MQLLDVYGVDRGVPEAPTGRSELDAWFDAAVERWVSGAHDGDYPESFPDFTERVDGALRRTVADGVGPAETVVVFTSGGPIAWAAGLAARRRDRRPGSGSTPCWSTPRSPSSTVGGRGTTAVSFNEHGHLPADLLTYR